MLTYRYLTRNKKRTLITLSSIVLVTVLFLCIGLLFSSIREYLIDEVTQTKGNYHVELKGNIKKSEYIKKIVTENGVNYITFDDIRKVYVYTEKMCQSNKCEDVIYNETLLSLYGLSENENMMDALISLMLVIFLVFSIGIILIIYNSFAISVMERKKQFSLLKSVGMTKRKIRHMVLLESLVLLIIGMMIGFIISVNVMFLGLHLISNLLTELFTRDLKLSFYPLFVIIPVLFVVFTVFLAAFIPAIKASRVSIVGGILNRNDFRYKKEFKFMKKLSITKRLAYLNYQRCKKKYRPIILCIFISTIIYVMVNLYLDYGVKSINDFADMPDYDAEVNIVNSSDEVYKKLESWSKDYDDYEMFNYCVISPKINPDSYLAKELKQNVLVIEGQDNYVINKIKGVETVDGKMQKVDKPYLNDNVWLKINDKEVKIKTKKTGPSYLDSFLTKDNMVFVTKDFGSYCPNFGTTLFLNGNINLEKDLSLWANDNQIKEAEYIDIKKANKITQNIIVAIKVVLYSMLILVLLIEISSLINTIWGSMNLRIKELATLKSVGATKKQINLILAYESFYLVLKGFIYALPFIFLINYILHQSLNEVLVMEVIVPYKEIITSFIFSFVIIYLTMIKVHKRFRNNEIITIITNDNI